MKHRYFPTIFSNTGDLPCDRTKLSILLFMKYPYLWGLTCTLTVHTFVALFIISLNKNHKDETIYTFILPIQFGYFF